MRPEHYLEHQLVRKHKNLMSSYIKNSTASANHSKSGTFNYGSDQLKFYELKLPYYFDREEFIDGTNTVTGLTLKNTDYGLQTKKILGITNDEMNLLKVLITNNSLNAKMFFQNALGDEKLEFITNDGLNYKKYYLKIVIENSQDDFSVIAPSEDIIVYTLDDLVYASSNYSEYIPAYQEKDLYGSLSLKE